VRGARASDLWWKNAVVYCLDVETFCDADGDGRGDLQGLTARLDHLVRLGVTCLWLMPLYPSPNRDDGYDVTDFYGVDPRLGTHGDFVVMLRAAKDRGLRVIIDLVVNHTSDRHPWFRAARADRDSPLRDHYVWSDRPRATPATEPVFPDAEDGIWSYDDVAGQWYLHHFYAHQPDLNIASPAVRDEIAKVAGFWLELGVDGFRVDAVPFLLETGGIADVDLDPHDLLRDLRAFIGRRKGDAVLLGEVNLPPRQLVRYFGDEDGDELHLVFDFPVMQRLYLALARRDARPLRDQLARRPAVPEDCQWANFVRNHDELTLDQLTARQREEVFAVFGPSEDEQLYGRGIRRRLPPMLDGDPDRIRLAYSLLLTLPGTPVLYYGEEIGMGEDLAVPGRTSVRTPMQWDADPAGGFSSAPARRLVRRPPRGRFGPAAVNVADQWADPGSLLSWFQRAIRRRRELPEIGWGALQLLDAGDRRVLAHRCDWEGRSVVAVHNLADEPVAVRVADVALPGGTVRVTDALDDARAEQHLHDGALELDLARYGYRWLLVEPASTGPVAARAGARGRSGR
jgi:maltose alpha-D-glucosyltransferase/alpha-amylase